MFPVFAGSPAFCFLWYSSIVKPIDVILCDFLEFSNIFTLWKSIRHSVFRRWKKLSIGALSKQFPLRDMLCINFFQRVYRYSNSIDNANLDLNELLVLFLPEYFLWVHRVYRRWCQDYGQVFSTPQGAATPKNFQNPDFSLKWRDFWVFL